MFVPIYWTGFEWKLVGPKAYSTVFEAEYAAAYIDAPTHVIHTGFVQFIADFEPPVAGKLVDFSAEDAAPDYNANVFLNEKRT